QEDQGRGRGPRRGHWPGRRGRPAPDAYARLPALVGLQFRCPERLRPSPVGLFRHRRRRVRGSRRGPGLPGQEETRLLQPAARPDGGGPQGERAMDQEPDVIKEQMAETRVSLTDKIEKLEDSLKETVETTLHTATNTVENVTEKVEQTVATVKEAVEGSLEAVTETVQETVESVKEVFNLRHHVQR